MSTPADTGPPAGQSVGDRSLGDLISEVTTDLSTLMRQELELAKAEVQQSASRAGKGAGMLGGIGFTMSIFIANLAFASAPEQVAASKLAVLVASLASATLGASWLAINRRLT